MSADAGAVLIRQKHVVGTDGDEPGVTDFHLVVKLDQTLGLAQVRSSKLEGTGGNFLHLPAAAKNSELLHSCLKSGAFHP